MRRVAALFTRVVAAYPAFLVSGGALRPPHMSPSPSFSSSSTFSYRPYVCQPTTIARLPAAATDPSSTTPAAAPSSSSSSSSTATPMLHGGNPTTVVTAPHRRVGNIFIVHCVDHPFKFGWEINRMLRELRLEYMGQTSIVPDIPVVRKQLWRVRHVVRIEQIDLDEAKALVGVPEHISFRDLNAQIPASFGRGGATANPVLRSKRNFMRYRRMRMRDVLHRDQLEKRLLEERRRALAQSSTAAPAAATARTSTK